MDADQVHTILTASLKATASAKATTGYHQETLDIDEARPAFYEIIHDSGNCPFPFIFC